MLTYLVYLLFILAILSSLGVIYCIYCHITLTNFVKDIKKSNKPDLSESSKLNIFLYALKHSKKVKDAVTDGDNFEKVINKKAKSLKKVIYTSIGSLITSAVMFFTLGSVVDMMNQQFLTVSTAIQTLFGKNEDCRCYALCTGDSELDSKCTYEIIFGPDEYDKLCSHMVLKPAEKESFNTINKGDNGKYKNDFISQRINDQMITDYKQAIGNNSKFRSDDGKDRTTMTNDELKTDLKALLADYKVNGRNPDCECQTASEKSLKRKCLGEKHWVKDWSWQELEDGEDPGSGNNPDPTEGFVPGTATGKYAVDLGDGSYYWYHQDGGKACGCTYCGDWSDKFWGSTDYHVFGSDGCAVYSLAMCVSNLVGAEVTPTQVMTDLGCTVTDKAFITNTNAFINRSIVRDKATSALASKYSLDVTNVEHSISSIDAILSKGGYVWGSWIDANCDWCGNGSTHFMVIRKQDGSNYYCFTSCRGKCTNKSSKEGAIETMQYPIEKQKCIDAMTSGQLYGFVNPNAGSGGGGGGGNDLSPTAEEVRQKLLNSQYASKADAMALAYDTVHDNIGTNGAIGIMANIWHEGTFGIVEEHFSVNHAHGFSLPSGGKYIKNKDDLNYLKNWDYTSTDKDKYPVQKGSCGVGAVQWSFDRRIQVIDIYIRRLGNAYEVSDDVKKNSEAEMIGTELTPGTKYYNAVSIPANNAGGSPEAWAEAFADYYERCENCCGKGEKMTQAGSACRTRRATATELAKLLKGN